MNSGLNEHVYYAQWPRKIIHKNCYTYKFENFPGLQHN